MESMMEATGLKMPCSAQCHIMCVAAAGVWRMHAEKQTLYRANPPAIHTEHSAEIRGQNKKSASAG